jgi:hypothetical protein
MKKKHTKAGRREFLKSVLIGSGAAAVAIASGGAAAAPEPKALDAKPTTQSQGYRETAHVREYYRVAQF